MDGPARGPGAACARVSCARPGPALSTSTGSGPHSGLVHTPSPPSSLTQHVPPWAFLTGWQLGHAGHIHPESTSPTTAFPGPPGNRQSRCACSPALGTPALLQSRLGGRGLERLCAGPVHSPRGLAGQGGLHCLSVQAPPAKQRGVRGGRREKPPQGGHPTCPPADPSLTTGPGSPRSPGKPRSPGGPSFPGRPAGPGSPWNQGHRSVSGDAHSPGGRGVGGAWSSRSTQELGWSGASRGSQL